VGRVYLTADDAAAAADRGERVILVPPARRRPKTSMGCSPPRASSRLGAVSCRTPRGWAGLGQARRGGGGEGPHLRQVVHHRAPPSSTRATWISIDGTAGEVVLGQVELAEAKASEEFERSSAGPTSSARAISRCAPMPITVRTPPTAGAWGRGIGLCRTEHMFIAEDRLPIVRRMILADDTAAEDAALEELRVAQRPTSSRSSKRWTGSP